jgi:predicted MPP superfamily phosphohydrolase
MRFPRRAIFLFLIVFSLFLGFGYYLSSGVAAALQGASQTVKYSTYGLFCGIQALFLFGVLYALLGTWITGRRKDGLIKFLGTAFVVFYVPFLIFGCLLFVEDIYRLLSALVSGLRHSEGTYQVTPRSHLYSLIAGIPGVLLLIGIFYGVTRGKYRYKVHRVELSFSNLPAAFDGFTITQLSDIHAGSFDNKRAVQKAIKLVNAQESDLLVFTGDLVNNKASEMDPWIDIFSGIEAAMGKFSILGNHDYGDYVSWPSEAHKEANMTQLYDVHDQIGFNLLKNDNLKIERDGEFIELLGIENWGSGRFAKYGDMDKTLEGTSAGSFKILLSHDPSHWKEQVVDGKEQIHLTLSGHTHGMQFGFEFKGIRFSPVQWRYKEWAGLYEKNDRYLYVNRGFGFLGFPGRVGIWPEITVITLKKKV